jgi:hypothetical protein
VPLLVIAVLTTACAGAATNRCTGRQRSTFVFGPLQAIMTVPTATVSPATE